MKENIYTIFHEAFLVDLEKTCICIEGENYTYKQVNDFSTGIYEFVRRVKSRNIGIMSHRTLCTYSGILGILKANRSYVPISYKIPESKIKNIIELTEIELIIADFNFLNLALRSIKDLDQKIKILIPEISKKRKFDVDKKNIELYFRNDLNIFCRHNPLFHSKNKNDVAYIMFTSGSTGVPKGVEIKHKQVFSYVKNINALVDFNSDDRFSQTFDISFDLSVHDLFVCWSNRATLCIPSRLILNPIKYIIENKISVWFSVPSVVDSTLKFFSSKRVLLDTLRLSLFCGEPLEYSQVIGWKQLAINSLIFNLYGPTEATIAISHYQCSLVNNKRGIVPLGTIFTDQKYIIDKENHTYGEGELCLSGSQVITRYYQSSESQHAFFLKNSHFWYRTGDIVVEEDGTLYFKRRKDDQIKLNGYRIELGEINRVLKDLTLAKKVVSCIDKKEIVSFVFDKSKNIDNHSILQKCSLHLPSYSVPKKIIYLDLKRMPLSINGKIDNKKLLEIYVSDKKTSKY